MWNWVFSFSLRLVKAIISIENIKFLKNWRNAFSFEVFRYFKPCNVCILMYVCNVMQCMHTELLSSFLKCSSWLCKTLSSTWMCLCTQEAFQLNFAYYFSYTFLFIRCVAQTSCFNIKFSQSGIETQSLYQSVFGPFYRTKNQKKTTIMKMMSW